MDQAKGIPRIKQGKDPPDGIEESTMPGRCVAMEVTVETTVAEVRPKEKKRGRPSEEEEDTTPKSRGSERNSSLLEKPGAVILTGPNIKECDQFEICSELQDQVGTVRGRCLRNGDFVLNPVTLAQRAQLLKITNLGNKEVNVKPFEPAPELRRILRGVPRKRTLEELTKAWQREGITQVQFLDSRRASNFTGKDLEQLSRTVLITFSKVDEIPTRVYYGFESFKVNPYVTSPIRCFTCQKYGHVAATCRGKETCETCAGPHLKKDCTSAAKGPKCSNCKGDHEVTDARCQHKKTATKVVQVVQATGRPYMEVRREILQARPGNRVSYAEVVIPSTTNPRNTRPMREGRARKENELENGTERLPKGFEAGLLPILRALVELLSGFLLPSGPIVSSLRAAIRQIDGLT